jgi:glycolate oxidase
MTALEIDPVNRVAMAEPGVLNVDLKQAAATHGPWYSPDPASFRISSIGGNVVTNAGGLCCLKYASPRITCSGWTWYSPTAG